MWAGRATKKLLPVCQLTLIIKARSPVLVFCLVHLVFSLHWSHRHGKEAPTVRRGSQLLSISVSTCMSRTCTFGLLTASIPALREGFFFLLLPFRSLFFGFSFLLYYRPTRPYDQVYLLKKPSPSGERIVGFDMWLDLDYNYIASHTRLSAQAPPLPQQHSPGQSTPPADYHHYHRPPSTPPAGPHSRNNPRGPPAAPAPL